MKGFTVVEVEVVLLILGYISIIGFIVYLIGHVVKFW